MSDNRDKVAEALGRVREYRGTPLYAALIDLLGAIDASYDDDMREVAPDGLRYKQGGAKQVRLLKESLIDQEHNGDIPKV